VQGGPAAEEVATEDGILLWKPRQDMREGVFEGPGHAVGQTDGVADHAAAGLDELRQGAHAGTLGAQGGARVAVCEEALDLECGIGGVICGPARGKRFAVRGHGERSDGTAPEGIRVTQRRHDGPFIAFQAHRDGLSVASHAEGLDPGVHLFRTMCKAQKLTVFGPSGLEADIVCRIRPIEANKGRKGFECWWLPVGSPRVWDSGAKGHAGLRSPKA
jgi:hypothetical protein